MSIPRSSRVFSRLPIVSLFFALFWGGCDSNEPDTFIGELTTQDLVAGTGPEVSPGQAVMVSYTGRLEDGTLFDDSADRSSPFAFTLGVGQVIEGWDEGIIGMRVGGKRRLVIPPNKAFGRDGVPGKVPGNATVTYEISLDALIDDVYIEDQVVGDGPAIESGKVATVNYVGLLSNGDVFDASEFRNQPFKFRVGSGEVIIGWDRGMLGMRVGGTRLLIIPYPMAYGPSGIPGSIPPYAVLTFQVTLLDVTND